MIQEIINCFCLRFALEAVGGIAAAAIAAWCCWNEEKLNKFEQRVAQKLRRRKRNDGNLQ